MNPNPPYNIFDLLPKEHLAMHQQFRVGFGKKVVLLHGLGSSGRYWNEPSNHLLNKYQLISYDLLGFGESEKPAPYSYYLWQQADALRQAMWIDHMWGKVNLVGHSLGALVALEFAKRYPKKVNKLVLCNIPLILSKKQASTIKERYSDVADNIRNELHRKSLKTIRHSKLVQEKLMPHYAERKKEEGVFKNYDLEHLSRYAYLQSIKHSIENYAGLEGLEGVQAETFVIAADKDRAVIKSNTNKLINALPKAKLIEVAGTHQFPVLQPKEFAKRLKLCLG